MKRLLVIWLSQREPSFVEGKVSYLIFCVYVWENRFSESCFILGSREVKQSLPIVSSHAGNILVESLEILLSSAGFHLQLLNA